MKKLRNQIFLILAIMVSGVTTTYAQNFQGIAKYQSAMKMRSFKMSGEGITPDMEKQLQSMMAKQGQKEFTLNFNLSESTWKEDESLGDAPGGASGGGVRVVSFSVGGGASSTTYKNTAEKLFMQESDVFGKAFLVKDELEAQEWQITGESKKIGNYTAQKAIYTRTVERQSFTFGDIEDEDAEPQTTTDTIKVEAWFTPEIPVSHGPENYWGLPGLILEVSNGSVTYLCTKVTLNPEEGVEIKKPKKGKKVNREEFQKIMEEKMEEMSKKYSGGGNGMSIKIGGGN